jgi:hypothetical protein
MLTLTIKYTLYLYFIDQKNIEQHFLIQISKYRYIYKKRNEVAWGKMIVQQLICDDCKKVILEKEGESYLHNEQFPISREEADMLDREHRGHQCHIEAVEKS